MPDHSCPACGAISFPDEPVRHAASCPHHDPKECAHCAEEGQPELVVEHPDLPPRLKHPVRFQRFLRELRPRPDLP